MCVYVWGPLLYIYNHIYIIYILYIYYIYYIYVHARALLVKTIEVFKIKLLRLPWLPGSFFFCGSRSCWKFKRSQFTTETKWTPSHATNLSGSHFIHNVDTKSTGKHRHVWFTALFWFTAAWFLSRPAATWKAPPNGRFSFLIEGKKLTRKNRNPKAKRKLCMNAERVAVGWQAKRNSESQWNPSGMGNEKNNGT